MIKPTVKISDQTPASSRRDTRTRLLACAVLVAVIAAFLLLDPLTCGITLRCPFKMATHLSCPGCGSQRALHALSQGHLSEALSYNYLLAVLIPLLVAIFLSRFVLSGRVAEKMKTALSSKGMYLTLVALVAAWTIVRNILNI